MEERHFLRFPELHHFHGFSHGLRKEVLSTNFSSIWLKSYSQLRGSSPPVALSVLSWPPSAALGRFWFVDLGSGDFLSKPAVPEVYLHLTFWLQIAPIHRQ